MADAPERLLPHDEPLKLRCWHQVMTTDANRVLRFVIYRRRSLSSPAVKAVS